MIMDHTVNTWKIQIKMKIFNICYQIPGVKVEIRYIYHQEAH